MIPESFIQELKLSCDIEQAISSYVRLTRRGKTLVGLCPFHNEKTPSFTVYPDDQHFYCFGCGAGGDVITFIRRAENLEYVEAVRLLAQRAGLSMPEEADDGAARLKMRILACNRAAAHFYYETLLSPAGAAGMDYFRARALAPGTIKRFGLGYAPEGWDALSRHLKGNGFSEDELVAARLCSRGKSGKGCYDVFRGRVMFPIIDLRGNVIAFGGRVLGEGGPKYLNSPDTPVFKKSRNLFALNRAKASKLPGLILAEGYMDVVALHQAGFDNAVATLGTSLTAEQTQLISKYAGEVVIAYDSDGAGQTATRRAINLFEEVNVKVRVLKMEGAKDPDEFIKKFGATRFKLLLEGSAGAVDFEIARLRAAHDLDTAEGRVAFLNDFARLMAGIRNPIERDVYVRATAGELAVSPEALLERIADTLRKRQRTQDKKQQRDLKMHVGAGAIPAARADPERERNLRYAVAEERLIALLLKNPDYYPYIAARITPERFVTSRNRRIFASLFGRLQNGQPADMMSLSAVLDVEDMATLSGLLSSDVQKRHPREEADDYINTILEHERARDVNEIKTMEDREWAQWAVSTAKGAKAPRGNPGSSNRGK